MLKELPKLLFLILFINNLYTQSESKKILFVGHAFGSHQVPDNNIDPLLLKFHNENNKIYDELILGGDFIYDCRNNEEFENFYNFFKSNNVNFVIGNHENCEQVLSLNETFNKRENHYELVGNNLILFLNTSKEDNQEINNTIEYIDKIIEEESPSNIIVFTHQLIFSDSDWHIRVNSRKYYDYANKVYLEIFKKYYKRKEQFYFIAGDIGAFKYTPFAFYDKDLNFNFLASGIGNGNNSLGLLIDIDTNVDFRFIDLKTLVLYDPGRFSKIKVQIYQLPKLILSILKKNYLFSLSIIVTLILVYLFQNRLKKNDIQ
tara:strand:- start:3818 stop:4768 length:951 start_codon:yes stop_codon:yes gene_type:complete